jgi:uncharacterized protein YajQ (UPF0234 family)
VSYYSVSAGIQSPKRRVLNKRKDDMSRIVIVIKQTKTNKLRGP